MWHRPGVASHPSCLQLPTAAPLEKPADTAASYIITLTADYHGGYRLYRSMYGPSPAARSTRTTLTDYGARRSVRNDVCSGGGKIQTKRFRGDKNIDNNIILYYHSVPTATRITLYFSSTEHPRNTIRLHI